MTDGQKDGRTDDGQSDPYVSLCFAGECISGNQDTETCIDNLKMHSECTILMQFLKKISGVDPRPDPKLREGVTPPPPSPFRRESSGFINWSLVPPPGSGGSGFSHADSPKTIHFPWWFIFNQACIISKYSNVGSVIMAYEEIETSYV